MYRKYLYLYTYLYRCNTDQARIRWPVIIKKYAEYFTKVVNVKLFTINEISSDELLKIDFTGFRFLQWEIYAATAKPTREDQILLFLEIFKRPGHSSSEMTSKKCDKNFSFLTQFLASFTVILSMKIRLMRSIDL